MKKIITISALLISAIGTSQVLDSLEFKTPDEKLVHTVKKDNIQKQSLIQVLDSLNNIYKTNRFKVWYYYDDRSIIEKIDKPQQMMQGE